MKAKKSEWVTTEGILQVSVDFLWPFCGIPNVTYRTFCPRLPDTVDRTAKGKGAATSAAAATANSAINLLLRRRAIEFLRLGRMVTQRVDAAFSL